ncbi:hypothetical protein [Caniella muris]|uniref:hypothetical protein n=1 Tax=Caniella muris TaxID=2941502 RepID=UPI002040D555|nr:hypothetical protein [Caniella muris]
MRRGERGSGPPARAAAALTAAVLTAAAATPALAFLSAGAGPVANTLSVREESVRVVEDFDPEPGRGGWVKKVVRVRNDGGTPCYVRALAVRSTTQVGCDISWGAAGWGEPDADGYRTYGSPLAPGEETEPLLTGLFLDSPSEPRDLQVVVYVESVQSGGFDDAGAAFAALAGEGAP